MVAAKPDAARVSSGNRKSDRLMAGKIRRVAQPGAPAPERIQWVEARGRAFSFTLEAGLPLLEAARRGFAAEGFAGGTLSINGGVLGPLAYVMPALPRTSEHAAYYSDTFRPAGVAQLTTATMTFGQRDDAPFFHCHGFWREADGRAGGGHLLPEETVVAESCEVEAFGLDGAIFTAEADPETNFKLFGPLACKSAGRGTRRVFALRLRPNQDFANALETFCRERGIVGARLRGGVGSIIGARFADGRVVEPFATEMAVRSGAIASRDGALEAELDIALVDHAGGLSEGLLARGDNPVLMTMELVLEVLDEH
jgi:predicted DNA-binding protein with PD1-like motif